MVLTLDIGNSIVTLGGFEGSSLVFTSRISTDEQRTEDEYASRILNALSLYRVDRDSITGAIVSSVVPPLTSVIKEALRFLFGVDALTVGPGIKTGINISCDDPSSVGADLICVSVAANHFYGSPALVVDMGTATKMVVVNRGGAFIGVSIIPGVMMGLDALADKTAQLPRIDLKAPSRVIGKNTADCMKSGVIFGNAAMVDGMIDRINEEMGEGLPVIATGGFASVIIPHCKHSVTLDEELILKGLNILYQKNA